MGASGDERRTVLGGAIMPLVGETFPGIVILHEFSVKIPPPCPARCVSTAASHRHCATCSVPSQLERNFEQCSSSLSATASARQVRCPEPASDSRCRTSAAATSENRQFDGRASLVLLPRTPASPRSQGRRHHRPGESEGVGAPPRAPVPVETGETRARTNHDDTSHLLPHDPQATHISGHDSVCRRHLVSMG